MVERLLNFYILQTICQSNDFEFDFNSVQVVVLDLSTVVQSVSGPKRPQDRINLREMKKDFSFCLQNTVGFTLENITNKSKNLRSEFLRSVSGASDYLMRQSNLLEVLHGTMEQSIL